MDVLKMLNPQYAPFVFLICLNVFLHHLAAVLNDPCPALFKRFNKFHTFCLPANASCQIIASGVSAGDVAIIVTLHNFLRSKVATGQESIGPLPKAANMIEMVWDNELEEVAQKHANQCKMEHDCNECRKIKHFDVGQNLYDYKIRSPIAPTTNWTAAIYAWYDEVKDFDPAIIPSYDGRKTSGQYGHLTQAIWATTWRIGCGYVLFTYEGYYHELYTCDYGPSGNIMNQPVYEYGEACSLCPTNSICSAVENSESFPGLCKIIDENGPYYKDDGEYLLQCDFRNFTKCPVKTPEGMAQWEIIHSLSDSYIGVLLNGGESTQLNFLTPLKPQTSMCLSLWYRKGANIDGSTIANTAQEQFYMSTGHKLTIPLEEDGKVFTKFSMSLNWKSETMFSISFSVPTRKQAQYLEIKDVFVKEGSC